MNILIDPHDTETTGDTETTDDVIHSDEAPIPGSNVEAIREDFRGCAVLAAMCADMIRGSRAALAPQIAAESAELYEAVRLLASAIAEANAPEETLRDLQRHARERYRGPQW